MSFRTYNEVTGKDQSGLLDQVLAQRARVTERLKAVSCVVAVVSGKGGVGKSYVTTFLARCLAGTRPDRVAVLDADLHSPTAARMLDAKGPLTVTDAGIEPAMCPYGVRVMSMDLLLPEGRPLAWNDGKAERFVWRGTLETGALREFLSDVVWGPLDFLLIDMPPGADRLSDLVELVPNLAGALVVTIPSDESRRSVERAMHAAKEAGVKLLGIVENMSGYVCRGCGELGPLFAGDAGAELASAFDVPLLGKIPFQASARSTQLPLCLAALDGLLP